MPQDLYKQDWWYRTTFTAPADRQTYRLDFPGINYRAEIWLNGHPRRRRPADRRHVQRPRPRRQPVDPARQAQHPGGEGHPGAGHPGRRRRRLADSWYDWINWRYLGYQGPNKNPANGNSFVPDRNAGIWKPVYLRTSGAVSIGAATVNSELPLPDTDSARLTVYARCTTIPRPGARRAAGDDHPRRQDADPRRRAGRAGAGEDRELSLGPDEFAQLRVSHPDLWWPYTMGRPDLYDLHLEFVQNGAVTAADLAALRHPLDHPGPRRRGHRRPARTPAAAST